METVPVSDFDFMDHLKNSGNVFGKRVCTGWALLGLSTDSPLCKNSEVAVYKHNFMSDLELLHR